MTTDLRRALTYAKYLFSKVYTRVEVDTLISTLNAPSGEFSGTMDDIPNGVTYVKTENNYTDTEKTKLSGIATGAEVNVNADWNAGSGDAQILNKPTIPTSIADLSGTMDDVDDGATYVKTHNDYTDADAGKVSTALQSETDPIFTAWDKDYADLTNKPTIPTVSDVAYDAGTWDANTDAPTKNAVRDKIESLASAKQDTLVSGTNIKTINSSSIVGSGNLVVTGSASMPRGHIWGLIMSNGLDSVNDIVIQAGEARDEAGTEDIILASAITKQIDAAWSVGTNAGGMNTGSVADNTWYQVLLIKRTDTGVVDVMFSTTANRATLPANYDKYRRIGWIRRGTATNLQFTQVEDYVTWTTQINDVAANKTLTATAVTLTVPPNTVARFRATADMSTSVNANSVIVFSEVAEGNVTPAVATGIGSLGYWDLATGVSAGHFELRVSSTSTIEHDSSVAVGAFDISTYGYIDRRCRLQNI